MMTPGYDTYVGMIRLVNYWKEMLVMLGLILFLAVIWVISEAVEGIGDIRAIIAPFAHSWYGILITVVVVAWVTYRCYQAKQRCGK